MTDDYAEQNSLLEEEEEEEDPSVVEEEADLSSAHDDHDPELEAIKARVRQMEEEAEKLKQMQSEVDQQMVGGGGGGGGGPMGGGPGSLVSGVGGGSQSNLSYEEKMEVDGRSVYVGNVDYGATAEELEQHFHGCGAINRVTILCNKFDGHPKGFAYVEFTDKDSVGTAMAFDDSLFRGRQIKVMPKRTNKPGITNSHRPPRGGRGGFRGASRGGYRGRGGFGAMRRPRYRGRGAFYSPY